MPAFTFVGFLHRIKESVGLDEQRLITKSSLAVFSCRGGQSVITHFCVDKLSKLQISLVGELTSAITLILMRLTLNSHSAETSETDSGHGRVTGYILGDPGAVSRVGGKGGTKVFKDRRKSPWVLTLTELFPKIQAGAGS